VAALEQLKTFAAIAGIPMEAVYQAEAMPKVLARHDERDAIFIDTAGRSQADKTKLDELGAFLEAAKPHEVLLCLAVSTRLEDQLDAIERYRKLNCTGIVFTKLDETRGPGMIPSVLQRADLPAVYLTCGQSVPDDILSVNVNRVADLILKPDSLTDVQQTHFESWIREEKQSNKREEDHAG
jgi:flagellar biosynthesis protein FlhF